MDAKTHITHFTQTPESEGLGAVFSAIYLELEHLARGLMRSERAGHTLGTTGVLHETYLRLIRSYAGDRKDMSADEIRAISSRIMRHVLVDHARRRASRLRASDAFSYQLDRGIDQLAPAVTDLIALDEALRRLEHLDERKAKIVELRFFSAMPMPKIAELLGTSLRSVERDWTFARAWLSAQLGEGAS